MSRAEELSCWNIMTHREYLERLWSSEAWTHPCHWIQHRHLHHADRTDVFYVCTLKLVLYSMIYDLWFFFFWRCGSKCEQLQGGSIMKWTTLYYWHGYWSARKDFLSFSWILLWWMASFGSQRCQRLSAVTQCAARDNWQAWMRNGRPDKNHMKQSSLIVLDGTTWLGLVTIMHQLSLWCFQTAEFSISVSFNLNNQQWCELHNYLILYCTSLLAWCHCDLRTSAKFTTVPSYGELLKRSKSTWIMLISWV